MSVKNNEEGDGGGGGKGQEEWEGWLWGCWRWWGLRWWLRGVFVVMTMMVCDDNDDE